MLSSGMIPRSSRSRPVSYTYICAKPHSVCTDITTVIPFWIARRMAGESLDLKTHVCMITSVDVYGHDRVSQDGAGNFLVYLGNNGYIAYDHSFAFVIYKM